MNLLIKAFDYLCIGAFFSFMALCVFGMLAVFVHMGIGCYQIDGNLPLAVFMGTIPIWAVLCFRGVGIMILREEAAKKRGKKCN